MLVAFSQLLLTSCGTWPLYDAGAWGDLNIRYSDHLFVCDPIQGLIVSRNSTGVAGPLVQSSQSIDAWRPSHFEDTRFAMELWLTPSDDAANDDARESVILSIGRPTRLDDDESLGGDDDDSYCAGLDFELSCYRRHFLLRFRTHDGCRTLYVSTFDVIPLQQTHLVVVFDHYATTSHINGNLDTLSVYANGAPIFQNVPIDGSPTATPLIRSWQPTSVLMLFGNLIHTNYFRGAVAQVAFYSGNSDYHEPSEMDWVQQLYQRGVVRAEPLLLQAAPSQLVTINQDAAASVDIGIKSMNASTEVFQISVEILSLPQHGKLYASRTEYDGDIEQAMNLVAVGEIMLLATSNDNVGAELILSYALDGVDYFNTPLTNAYGDNLQLDPEALKYRLVAHDALGLELAVSDAVRQSILVLHVNHPPVLTGPAAIGPAKTSGNTATLTGIKLQDSLLDYNIDRVRVDVWATTGYLTLAIFARHLADFDSCRGRTYSAWQCTGDGQRNRNMTFVAIPDDVNRILEEVTYEAMLPGVADDIIVRVSDGQDGACLSAEEQVQYHDGFGNADHTAQRKCFQVELYIHVHALVFDSGQNYLSPEQGFLGTKINTARLLFWSVAVAIMICCAGCLRRCPRCLARGNKIYLDDDDHDEDSIDDTEDGNGSRASF